MCILIKLNKMTKTLRKYDIARALAANSELSIPVAQDIVNEFFELMSETLESGQNITIEDFGRFKLRDKKERMGRNPKTMQEHVICARRTVSYYNCNALRDAVRGLDR